MTTAAIKNNLHNLIDAVRDNTILKAVQTILEKEVKNEIVGYTVEGKPLTRELMEAELEEAERDIEAGRVISHAQLKKEIKNWRIGKKK